MTEPDWYFRNRSRDAIIAMFRMILELQKLNRFRSSEILLAMVSVWRQEGDALLASSLLQVAQFVRREERRNR